MNQISFGASNNGLRSSCPVHIVPLCCQWMRVHKRGGHKSGDVPGWSHQHSHTETPGKGSTGWQRTGGSDQEGIPTQCKDDCWKITHILTAHFMVYDATVYQ